MDQPILSLAALVEAFAHCFHPQVFSTFQSLDAYRSPLLSAGTLASLPQKGQAGHKPRPQSAADLARKLAEANLDRTFRRVGDSAYIKASLFQARLVNLPMIGPLHWKAALFERPEPPTPVQRGRRWLVARNGYANCAR